MPKISFACDNCRSSFTVDAQLAGRQARCRKCGRRQVIPGESAARRPLVGAAGMEQESGRARGEARSAVATASPARAGAATGTARSAGYAGGRSLGWMDAVNSQVALKPVSVMDSPALRERRTREIEEFEDSRTSYKVIVPREIRKEMRNRGTSRPAGIVRVSYLQSIRSYKKLFSNFGALFRWIDEAAYGLSIPCLILAIVGAVMNKHWMAVLGVSAIVLLNLVRVGAALFNLICKPFRDNPLKGVLFLLPPVALFYLWSDWRRWHKPVKRILSPVLTLGLVILAYSYIPWLNGNRTAQGQLRDRIEGAIESIKQDVSGSISDVEKKVGETRDGLPGQLEKLKDSDVSNRAQQALDGLKQKIHESTAGDNTAGPGAPSGTPPDSEKTP